MATCTSIVSSSLGDQLNCAVCLERFVDPRTLPCHHSFCIRCLRGVPRQLGEDCILIKCPTCRKTSQLPEGGMDQLPTAFLINNLLELHNQTEHDQEQKSPSCDAHARPLEFYCSTCRELLCSVCTIKEHRAHNCDLASDVIKDYKRQIKQQLDLLKESATKVEAILEEVDSATEKVQDEGDKTRQKIIAQVDQLHRDLELGKAELIDMLDQGVQDKIDFLANIRERVVTILAQMRSSQTLVEETVKREHTVELLANDELEWHVFEAQKQYQVNTLTFTAPSAISFLSNPSANIEIGFLIEPVGSHHDLKIRTLVAGEKCDFLLYLLVTNNDDLVCELVPNQDEGQAIECQITPLKEGKHQVSFTPHRVGTHNLTIVSASTKKKNISEIQVNSPFLRGSRKLICKQVLRQPRSVAITKEGQLPVVCERGADCITVCTTEGEKIKTISSCGSKKKVVFKPWCVGVTHDNHIVVIENGKRIQVHKLQLDGKIVNTSTITSKDVSKFQSPNCITEHPMGQVFVVDSASHCIHAFNADLSYFRSFGDKGDAPGQFNQPHSLVLDSSGYLYVSDSMNHRIQKFTMNGDLLKIFGKGDGSKASHLTQPRALCTSSYDTIFVADECRRIAAFDVQGNLLGEVHYDRITLRNPCAMAVHKNESYICVIDSCADALYVIQ